MLISKSRYIRLAAVLMASTSTLILSTQVANAVTVSYLRNVAYSDRFSDCLVTVNTRVNGDEVDRVVGGGNVDEFRTVIVNATGGVVAASGTSRVAASGGFAGNRSVEIDSSNTATGPLFVAIQDLGQSSDIVRQLQLDVRAMAASGPSCRAIAQSIGDPNNTAPTASAGTDIIVNNYQSGTTVRLDASASNDADRDSLSYSWAQTSGPSVNLTGATSTAPFFNFNTTNVSGPQVFEFEVTVSDGLATSTDTVSVTLNKPNNAPNVVVGPDVTLEIGTDARATLVNAGSSDPDGDTLTYRWTRISGPVSSGIQTSPTGNGLATIPNTTGTQVFRLTATDTFGATGSSDMRVTWVDDVNETPVANAGADQTIDVSVSPNGARLTAGSSTDADRETLTYEWEQISGRTSVISSTTATAPQITAPARDTVQVWRVTATDPRGLSSTDEVTLTWTNIVFVNTAPVADAGADQASNTNTNGAANTVTLDAGNSADPDGDSLTYSWALLSGPISTLNTSTAQSIIVQAPATTGTQTWEVTVDDGSGGTDTDTLTIVWSNPPITSTTPPAQNTPSAVIPGAIISLAAGTVANPNGGALTYRWVQTGGPTVTLIDTNLADASFAAPSAGGTLTFELTISNGIDSIVVPVSSAVTIDQTPTSNAGADQTLVDVAPGTVVTLDGTGSTDPEGTQLTYVWTQVSGPIVTLSNASTATPSFVFPRPSNQLAARKSGGSAVAEAGQPVETLVFELVVSDSQQSSSADQVSVTINTNEAPIADAGEDQTLFGLDNGATLTLDGSGSSDPDGDPLTYIWSILSGTATLTNETTVTPTLTYTGSATDSSDDAVEIQLVVNDGSADSVADTVSLSFRDNRAPTANAGNDQSQINSGETVTLSASTSSDPDGDSLTYVWTQVSGPSVTLSDTTSESPTFTAPDVSGNTNLVFEVTVNDGKVDSASDRVTIGVQPTGSITIIQQTSGGDSAFPFTSTVSDLNGSITTQGGTGQLVSTRVNAGTYTITAADKRDDGFALTDLICSDADSTVSLASRQATIILSPGEDLTCTFSSVNSRGAAEKAIRDMLVQRNKLILSNQPDLTRRLNRLKGQWASGGGVKVAGLQIASNENIPLTAELSETGGSLSSSLSQSQGKTAKSGKGSFDVWGEGTLAQFESLGKDGKFSIFYAGADYMVSDKLLVGALVQFDDFKTDSRNKIGDADGNGFMAGPYATAKLGNNIYVDGRVAWGASSNSINPLGDFVDDFDTNRFIVAGSVSGDVQIKDTLNLRPTLAIRNLSETQKSYVDILGVSVGEQKVAQGEISFAPRLEKSVALKNGWSFRPYGSVEGIVSFGDEVETVLENSLRARLEGGASWSSPSGFNAGISAFADGVGSDRYDAQGIRLSLSYVMHNN